MERALALALPLVIFISLVAGMQTIKVANANFFPGDTLIISSPISNMVYANTSLPLKIIASVANPTPEVVSITYCLDGTHNVTWTGLSETLREPGHIDGSQFYLELVLKDLSEGNHTLDAYSKDAIGREMSASAEFVIDTSYTEPLTVLSPQNRTYYSSEVPLTFVCREDGKYDGRFNHGVYNLDGIGSDFIYDNLTLTDLSVGSHIIVVGASTETWWFYKTVYFSISEGQEPVLSPNPSPTASPSPSPEPTLTPEPTPFTSEPTLTPESTPTEEPEQTEQDLTAGAVFAVTSIVVFLGLLFYFIKRK